MPSYLLTGHCRIFLH